MQVVASIDPAGPAGASLHVSATREAGATPVPRVDRWGARTVSFAPDAEKVPAPDRAGARDGCEFAQFRARRTRARAMQSVRAMRRTTALCALLLASLAPCGCGASSEMVPLLTAAGIPRTDPTDVPLRVVTRSTAVHDPLRVRNTTVVYADVEVALGHAVSSAAAPWANQHRDDKKHPDGWELFVEVTNADASYEDDRVIFSLGVRATLRARAGDLYLAQTQASCRQGGIVPADKGAPVVYGCMMEIGRNLAGWLEGVDLDAVGPPHEL